ncbi:MAG: proton-conducting transporter membrane subunit [Gammaproteobacteria bacterium]|nr:proton-conducting transporter membrane subunit [Gammaproteobacteria bacterium]MDH3986268.1 proton-conducting transporter membrane subunit [Gammaproteobacteria bacterium]
MSPEIILLACIALPLLAPILISALHRWPNPREAVTLLTSAGLLLLVLSLHDAFLQGARPAIDIAEPLPGLAIGFEIEPLGMLFALLASFLWLVTSVYSIGYMRSHHEWRQTSFYSYFAVALGSVMGIAFAGNLFTLFIFYELLTLSTYPLVTHSGDNSAREGGRMYLGYLLGTSLMLLLLALIWTWSLTGTLDFREGGILAGTVSPAMAGLLLALYIFGIGKAAVIPMHLWLPAAMVAPTPVSALLHAVAVVKAGVFTVLKVTIYIFGIDFLSEVTATQWLMYVAGATILLASIVALRQDNLKLRLAWSTVSQLSYIVLCALLITPTGIIAGSAHMVMHGFAKITLFFCAGAILVMTHKTRISELDGIGRQMPWTMAAFSIAAISMIGIPPTAGFISKWYILLGTIESQQLVALGIIIISTLLNAAYFMPIVYAAFFREQTTATAHESRHNGAEAPLTVLLAITVTAAGTLALFFFPDKVLELAMMTAGAGR